MSTPRTRRCWAAWLLELDRAVHVPMALAAAPPSVGPRAVRRRLARARARVRVVGAVGYCPCFACQVAWRDPRRWGWAP